MILMINQPISTAFLILDKNPKKRTLWGEGHLFHEKEVQGSKKKVLLNEKMKNTTD